MASGDLDSLGLKGTGGLRNWIAASSSSSSSSITRLRRTALRVAHGSTYAACALVRAPGVFALVLPSGSAKEQQRCPQRAKRRDQGTPRMLFGSQRKWDDQVIPPRETQEKPSIKKSQKMPETESNEKVTGRARFRLRPKKSKTTAKK